jgi:hypothetical protein
MTRAFGFGKVAPGRWRMRADSREALCLLQAVTTPRRNQQNPRDGHDAKAHPFRLDDR